MPPIYTHKYTYRNWITTEYSYIKIWAFIRNLEVEVGFNLKIEMLEGKALIEDTDMPLKMRIQAMDSASQALDLYDVMDCKSIAAHIKKEFDKRYGNGWQCVVGSNFGCFFTHTEGTFIYFTLETLNFLIFKGATSP